MSLESLKPTAPGSAPTQRFRLRPWLVVLLGAGLCFGWSAFECDKAAREAGAWSTLGNLGANTRSECDAPRSEWQRVLFGDNNLGLMRYVNLSQTDVTDSTLASLRRLTQLRRLALRNTQVTDAGLVHLVELKTLENLALSDTQVSDAGLSLLAGLASLKQLHLENTHITDAGLSHLPGLKRLEVLNLTGTAATSAGVQELQQALPDLEVVDAAGSSWSPKSERGSQKIASRKH